MRYEDVAKNKLKLAQGKKPQLATVKEVNAKGVKLHIEGEEEPRSTFYNSLEIVNVGDRVYFVNYSGGILIIASLKYGGNKV